MRGELRKRALALFEKLIKEDPDNAELKVKYHKLRRLMINNKVYAQHREFQYELNAFLSASRAVSFVLQKAMAGVKGFDTWYNERRAEMKRE